MVCSTCSACTHTAAGCPALGAVSWQAPGDSQGHRPGHQLAPPGHLMLFLPAGCAAGRQPSLQAEVGTKFVPPKLVRTFMGESAYSAVRETLLQQQAAHMHQLSELHRLVGVQRQLTQQLSFGGGSSAGERALHWEVNCYRHCIWQGRCAPVRPRGLCAHRVQPPASMLLGTEGLALSPWVKQSKLCGACTSAGPQSPLTRSVVLADHLLGLAAWMAAPSHQLSSYACAFCNLICLTNTSCCPHRLPAAARPTSTAVPSCVPASRPPGVHGACHRHTGRPWRCRYPVPGGRTCPAGRDWLGAPGGGHSGCQGGGPGAAA